MGWWSGWLSGEGGEGGRGAKDDLSVPRGVRFNARQFAEHPFADRAEGIVGKGIHRGVLLAVHTAESMVFGIAVPMFPDRRGTLLDFVAPRRELAALEMVHGQIVFADAA